ncbi:MAG: dihydrofolate reductase [Candidatus Paceibacterota bacterium]
MKFNAIACINYNNAIGWENSNDLIFFIQGELEYFRKTTIKSYDNKMNIIIMGRKTWDSFKYKKPLPGRYNCVISSDADKLNEQYKDEKLFKSFPNIECFMNFSKQNEDCFNDVFVIGGKTIYEQFLKTDLIDRIYLTEIETMNSLGDVFFPINYVKNFNMTASTSYKDITVLNKLDKSILNLDYSLRIYDKIIK